MFDQPADLDVELQRTGGELLELATRDPDNFARALQSPAPGALTTDAVAKVRARASRTLSAQLTVAPGQ